MAINQEKKSNRLLGNRRFTSADLNTSQEAFQNVLDLRSEEIYTQAGSIPSSGLPFSGSSQHISYYTVNGENILRYWFRHRLTKSSVGNDVWFFLNPIGSSDGITPQLINDNQLTNFISPKYSVSALANANTEDDTPGYGIKVFKSTSTNSGSFGGSDIVSTNDYQFDYKTGVLQFDQNTPGSSDIVYMSVYQYVGQTLATKIEVSGDISGSHASTGSFGDLIINAAGGQQFSTFSSSIQSRVAASEAGNITQVTAGSGLTGGGSSGAVTLNLESGVVSSSAIGDSQGEVKINDVNISVRGMTTSGTPTFNSITTTLGSKFGNASSRLHTMTGSFSISGSETGHGTQPSASLIINAPGTSSVGILLKNTDTTSSPSIKFARKKVAGDYAEQTLALGSNGLETEKIKLSNNLNLDGRIYAGANQYALSATNTGGEGEMGSFGFGNLASVNGNIRTDLLFSTNNFVPLTITKFGVLYMTGSISSSADTTASFGELMVGSTNRQLYSAVSKSISSRLSSQESGVISSVGAGVGLSGGGSSGAIAIDVDFTDTDFGTAISGSFGSALNSVNEVVMNRGGELSSSAALKVVTDGYGTHTLATDLKSGGSFRIFPKNSNVYIGSGNIGATGGSRNIGLGSGALYNNNNSDNVGVGNSALGANTTGWENTAIGSQAGTANITGDNSIWMGYRAGYVMTAGSFNTILGTLSANALAGQVSYNTLVGGNIGQTNTAANKFTSGSYNTYLGYGIRSSGRNSSIAINEIAIGAGVFGMGSNTVTIGATPRSLTDNSAITHGGTATAATDYYMSGSGTAVMHIGSLNAHSHITSSGNISGSHTSTGSFGNLRISNISQPDIKIVSSSISTRTSTLESTLTTEQTNIDNLQTDSGSFSTRITSANTSISTLTTNVSLATASIASATSSIGILVSRNIDSGTGLSGGGDLSSDRTLSIDFSDSTFAAGISGSFKQPSSSISSRLSTVESNAGGQALGETSTPTFASLTLTGDLIAKNYIVSSSVTHMTRSFSSGSSIFGDDILDTHQFTGSINTSGSITAVSFVGNGSGLTNVFEGTAASSSISTRLTAESTNIDNLQTNSGSFSTRITNATSSISGLKTDSGSFSTRITDATASIQSISQSLQSRIASSGDVTLTGVQTLTNKTLTAPVFSGNVSSSGAIVFTGTSGIELSHGETDPDNRIKLVSAGAVSATRTITFPDSSGGVVLDGATQTLENKTLTSPDINGGTVDAITSLSIANNVNVGNFAITASAFKGDGSGLTNVFENTTPSSSISTRLKTLESDPGGIFIATGSVQATTNNLQVTGSVTATSFVGDGSNLTGLVTANSVQFSAFDSDSNGDLMPTAENVFSRILYELDDNNDLMPI